MMQNIANVLNTLSDRLIAPQLVALLSNKQVSKNVRARVATILSQVADGEKEIALMFTLLPASDIADSIYSALWTLSRRLGLRILVSKESQEQHMTVIKMREVLTQESP